MPDFTPIIADAYREILTREPDAGGLSFYNERMNAGMSEADLRETLLRSPEYETKHPGSGRSSSRKGREGRDGSTSITTATRALVFSAARSTSGWLGSSADSTKESKSSAFSLTHPFGRPTRFSIASRNTARSMPAGYIPPPSTSVPCARRSSACSLRAGRSWSTSSW